MAPSSNVSDSHSHLSRSWRGLTPVRTESRGPHRFLTGFISSITSLIQSPNQCCCPTMQETRPDRPFADHVQSRYGNSQSWLTKFLRQGYAARYWEPRNPWIDIYILDTVEGAVASQSFQPHRTGNVDAAFLDALNTRPPNSKSRLIMIQAGQLGDTNGAYLDAIGWQYKLDPHFFCAHLQGALYLTEGERIGGPPKLPLLLASERDYLTVVTDSNSYLNATVLDGNDNTTTGLAHSLNFSITPANLGFCEVILLGLDYFDSRITTLKDYLTDPMQSPKEAILAADAHPCDFLLHYVTMSLRDSASLARQHGRIEPQSPQDRHPTSFTWEWNQATLRNLLQSRNSIARFVDRKYSDPQKDKPRLAQTISDFDEVIAETRENASQLHSMLQNHIGAQAINEAQKSLEQADAVRKYGLHIFHAAGYIFLPW